MSSKSDIATAIKTAATQVSPEKIMQLGTAFWSSKVFLSAVELGVFTTLAKEPMDAETLSKSIGLNDRGSADFLDCLVSLGVLKRTEGLYSNTPETETYLDSNNPAYIGGFFEMLNSSSYHSWGELSTVLKTGISKKEIKAAGDDLFEALYADPKRLQMFLQAMTGVSRPCATAIAEKFPWQKYSSFVDVGTAQGGLAVEIVKKHSHLRGIGFDLHQCESIFEAFTKENQVEKQLTFQAGDFFKQDLPSTDVLIMGHILHDWNLEQKRMLIAKAHKALSSGGALIVYETMIDDQRKENTFALLMSLNMLVKTPGGFDFTPSQLKEWLKEAGFKDITFTKLPANHTMAVAIK